MFGVSSLEVLQATFVNRCALQVYKTIEKIYENRCCGCKALLENQDCLMLTKAEIMESYFNEAIELFDFNSIASDLQSCVNVLIPQTMDQWLFFCQWFNDPRKNDKMKVRIKGAVKDMTQSPL